MVDDLQEHEQFEQESDLFEHLQFLADQGQAPLRVDKFLTNFVQNATRNKVQNAIRAGNVLVNDAQVKPNYKIKAGDLVKVVFSYPPKEDSVIAQDIPIDIVYEDEQVVVVNKAAGMVVHPGHGNYEGTLVNALKYHFDKLPSMNNQLERPGLVHRLDKDTTGLMVIAKTEIAMQHLARQFFERSIYRRYLALVWRDLEDDNGTIEGAIGRHTKDRLQMTVYPDGSQGKHAITHYKVIERFGYVSLCECRLETGRTHQIRVHMKHIGHTLFNDSRYGGDKILSGTTFTKYKQFIDNCFQLLPRTALHAAELGFIHPRENKEVKFLSPLPNDINSILVKWRVYSSANRDKNS